MSNRRANRLSSASWDSSEALLTGSSPVAERPEVLPRLASGELPALCHTIDYPEA